MQSPYHHVAVPKGLSPTASASRWPCFIRKNYT